MEAKCVKCGEMFQQKNGARQCGKCGKRLTIWVDNLTIKKIQNFKADYINSHQSDTTKLTDQATILMLIKESPKIAEQNNVSVTDK